MKRDALPPRTVQLLEFAAARDFYVHLNVGRSGSRVMSIDDQGSDLIRFFSPEVHARPWGSQLSGNIGLAFASPPNAYRIAVFHHILNYPDFVNADRTVDNKANLEVLLEMVREQLEDLPSNPSSVIAWAADTNTWLGKFAGWGRPDALAFISEAKRGQGC